MALETYYGHLSTQLAFPFTAERLSEEWFGEESMHSEREKVIGLGEPSEPKIDEVDGILCEARVDGCVVALPLGELDEVRGKANRQLVEDYCYWLHNFA